MVRVDASSLTIHQERELTMRWKIVLGAGVLGVTLTIGVLG